MLLFHYFTNVSRKSTETSKKNARDRSEWNYFTNISREFDEWKIAWNKLEFELTFLFEGLRWMRLWDRWARGFSQTLSWGDLAALWNRQKWYKCFISIFFIIFSLRRLADHESESKSNHDKIEWNKDTFWTHLWITGLRFGVGGLTSGEARSSSVRMISSKLGRTLN